MADEKRYGKHEKQGKFQYQNKEFMFFWISHCYDSYYHFFQKQNEDCST